MNRLRNVIYFVVNMKKCIILDSKVDYHIKENDLHLVEMYPVLLLVYLAMLINC